MQEHIQLLSAQEKITARATRPPLVIFPQLPYALLLFFVPGRPGMFYKGDLQEVVGRLRSAFRLPPSWSVESMVRGASVDVMVEGR